MKTRIVVLFFMVFAVLAFTGAGVAGDKLTVKVSPAVAFAPANLTIRTIVEVDPDNRAVRISAESPDFYRSSEVDLEGDRAPRTTTFEFHALPTGTYEVRATLFGTGGQQRAVARQQVDVVSSPGDR